MALAAAWRVFLAGALALGACAATDLAEVRLAATGLRRIVVHIIRDKEIEPSIAVVVEEHRRGSPAFILNAGGVRLIFKRAIASVHEEVIGAEAGHVNVWKPVVVDVPHGRSHAVAEQLQAR